MGRQAVGQREVTHTCTCTHNNNEHHIYIPTLYMCTRICSCNTVMHWDSYLGLGVVSKRSCSS